MRKITFISLFFALFLSGSMQAQENTYNMIIEMANGSKISIGPNDVKNITFYNGELLITDQSLQEWMESVADKNEVYAMSDEILYRIYKLIGPLNEYLESSDWNVGDKLVEKLQALEAQMKDNEMNSNQLATALAALQTLLKDLEDQHDTDISDLQHQIDELKSRIEALEAGASTDPVVQDEICPDGNHPHMIDLGLPSGTKWACCNVGANSPEQYGGYFAWGMTSDCKGKDKTITCSTDYNEDGVVDMLDLIQCQGFLDNKGVNIPYNISGTDYDPAYVNWGNGWQVGSTAELDEYCTKESGLYKNVPGLYYIGTNGEKLFFPAAGRAEFHEVIGYDDEEEESIICHQWYEIAEEGLGLYYRQPTLNGGSNYDPNGYSVRAVSRNP